MISVTYAIVIKPIQKELMRLVIKLLMEISLIGFSGKTTKGPFPGQLIKDKALKIASELNIKSSKLQAR